MRAALLLFGYALKCWTGSCKAAANSSYHTMPEYFKLFSVLSWTASSCSWVFGKQSLFLIISFNRGLNKGFFQKGKQHRKILNHFHGWKWKLPNLFRKDFLKGEKQGGEDCVLSSLRGMSPYLVDEENSMLEIYFVWGPEVRDAGASLLL